MTKAVDVRDLDVCPVGGGGRVGPPPGAALAARDQRILRYDIDAAAVGWINAGAMPFAEVGATAALAEALVVAVGTPVDEHLDPVLGAVSGNAKLAISHVLHDFVQNVLKGRDPLRSNLARGAALATEHEAAPHGDLNQSMAESTTVLALAAPIWPKEVKDPDVPFRYVSDEPFGHDVAMRVPDVPTACEVLGFPTETTLDALLDETIPWNTRALEQGRR